MIRKVAVYEELWQQSWEVDEWVRKSGSSVLPGMRSDVYNQNVLGVGEITFA